MTIRKCIPGRRVYFIDDTSSSGEREAYQVIRQIRMPSYSAQRCVLIASIEYPSKKIYCNPDKLEPVKSTDKNYKPYSGKYIKRGKNHELQKNYIRNEGKTV